MTALTLSDPWEGPLGSELAPRLQPAQPLHCSWVYTHSTESHSCPHRVSHTCSHSPHTHTQSLHSFMLVHVWSHNLPLSYTQCHTHPLVHTPLLGTPQSHFPWVPMASTDKGDPGDLSAASTCVPAVPALPPALPGPLLFAGAAPGGDGCPWCGSRVCSWAARSQARCWPAASRLQNRSSLFLHRPKAGGVRRCHPCHPSSCPARQPASAHPTKERNHPHISPSTCLRLTPTNPHLYQWDVAPKTHSERVTPWVKRRPWLPFGCWGNPASSPGF